jgi:hypothetical protein
MKMLNLKNKSQKALDWLQKKSGIPAEQICFNDTAVAEIMMLRHLHRTVLCEEFRKGHVKRELNIGGNSINNSLKYHAKNMESRVYQAMYNELRDYVYEK